MIKNTGYFPELSYIYGGEHEVFTKNYMKSPISYDIISSNSRIKGNEPNIELNEKSAYHKSMNTVDKKLWDLNGIKCSTYLSNLGQYIPYSDGSEHIEIIIYDNNNIDNIINYVLSSLYLNITIINKNNNKKINKYKNKLYIKIINRDVYEYISTRKNNIYILNKKNNISFNNIHFIDNINKIKELINSRN